MPPGAWSWSPASGAGAPDARETGCVRARFDARVGPGGSAGPTAGRAACLASAVVSRAEEPGSRMNTQPPADGVSGQGVASCSRSTCTASTVRLMPPTSASPTPSAPPSPSPALAMKATPAASRQPEMAGQPPDAGRNGRCTAPADGQHTAPTLAARPRPWPFPPPSVDFTAPKSGTHGRIADGGSPKSSLETNKCWSAGGDSNGRSVP